MHLRLFHLWLVSLPLCLATAAAYALPAIAYAVILCAHFAVFIWGVFDIKLRFFCPALIRGKRDTMQVAVTFDDGPNPALTPAVLDILKHYGIPATFFVIGEKARAYPDIIRRMDTEGHTVGCHDLNHGLRSNFRLCRTLIRDIGTACATIEGIIGKRPLLYRPPVGLTNPHTFKALRTLGLHCIGWSRSAGDAGNRRTRGIEKISKLAGPGEVLLLHDSLPKPDLKETILGRIENLCADIKARNLQPVTVNMLFGIETYGPQSSP